MKKKFKIIILASDFARLISRIIIILNRRNIDILYLNVSPLEDSQTIRCTLKVENSQECIEKIIKQIDKQIGVISALYKEIDKENLITCIKQKKEFSTLRIYSKLSTKKPNTNENKIRIH